MISMKKLITQPGRILPGMFLTLMLVALAACNSNQPAAIPAANTQNTTPATQEQPTGQSISAAEPTSGLAVLYQDNFSVPSTDWNVIDTGDVIREYAEGEFRTYVDNDKNPHRYPMAFVEGTFGDVRLEVDFRRISGSNAARAHLVCRRVGEQEYVFGSIDFQGEARIGTFLGDMQEIVASEVGFDISPTDMNRLRLDCIGNTISLYVNGELAVTTPVEAVPEGAVGFAAGGATEGQTDMRFDNFIVYALDNQGSTSQIPVNPQSTLTMPTLYPFTLTTACNLVTSAEAEAAVGSPVSEPIEENYPPIFSCRYTSEGSSYVDISVVEFASAAQAAGAFEMIVSNNDYPEVQGIGDRAIRPLLGDIDVLSGKYDVTITIMNEDDEEMRFEKARELAALVLERLP